MKHEDLKLYTTTYIRQNTVQKFFRIEVVSNEELDVYDGCHTVCRRIDINKYAEEYEMELTEEAKEIAKDYDFYHIEYAFETTNYVHSTCKAKTVAVRK